MSRAVRVVDVPDDEDEAEMMGGTACMVEFHRRCAPPDLTYGSGVVAGLASQVGNVAKQAKKARRNL